MTGAADITVDDFQAEARAWLADHRDEAPRDYGAICPPAGFAGIHWPTEFGGRALSAEHNAAWMVECAIAGVPSVLNMVGLVLAGGAILRYGTAAQQSEHLRATLAADRVWCQLFSEPGAGSDLGGLTTKAERDGERFIINGQKVWCSGGRCSDWGILMARTDPGSLSGGTRKHDGISFFLCPMDLNGIEIRPLRQMTGEAEFDEVFFTDVELPAEHLLGPLHGGWGVGMGVLTSERGHIGTSIVGLERRLESMAELAEGRELGAVERQRLSALIARGHSLKAMAQRQGPIASTSASLLKLGITEMMFDVSMLRGGLSGAVGMLDGPDAFGMLAAPGGRIAGGTSQVQRNIIGERLLGLPREPKG
jgi:alkylation response protein AidB-like acyl-CoA dehydrogenase